MGRSVRRRSILARFPLHRSPGHEQEGVRPALIVGLPERLGAPRFPTVLVAPLTSHHQPPWADRSPALYPQLAAGVGRLPRASIVLLDQVRVFDQARLVSYLGSLTAAPYAPVDDGVRRVIAPPSPPLSG